MTAFRHDALCIGNAIVDVLGEATDDLLDQHGMAKGGMTLVGEDLAGTLYAAMDVKRRASGGSAANTAAGIASLGGGAAYVGRVRDDELGAVFRSDIEATGVTYETPPSVEGPSTARCLVFVTPDGQRTMNTYLGASVQLGPADIDPDLVAGAAVTYLEGYLWDPPEAKEAFRTAARIAHDAGRRVALSLSDRFCVDRHRKEFRDLVEGHVDILFGNEDEFVALYEATDFDGAVAALGDRCELAAITRGAEGSVVISSGRVDTVAAEPVERVVDTTGAGDLYAAGFLYGLARGMAPVECARIGGIAAAEIISHYGARPERTLSELLPG